MSSRGPLALLAACAGLAVLGLALFIQPEAGVAPQGAHRTGENARPAGSATADQLIAATGGALNQPSAEARNAFLASGLRFKLEDLVLEAGEASTPAILKQQLAALAPKYFSEAELSQAMELLDRYVDYRVAVGAIKPPSDPGDPAALRAVLDARRLVREKHFRADECAALFAQEEELDRFTVARLEIERNPDLSAEQKAAAVRDAERDLSESQRATRADAVAHLAVASQSAAFEATGASEQERYAQRRAQYGDTAAQQLAQLDREERDWQARLDEYSAGKARNEPPAQLNRMRQQLFSTEEQLRVEAALALRRQARALPTRP
jgi:lipase chaperone LimK